MKNKEEETFNKILSMDSIENQSIE